jgi:hypothetical protein
MTFGDNDKAIFGAGSDLQIYHDGSHSIIKDSGSGNLYIGGASSVALTNTAVDEFMLRADQNGTVVLYYDNSAKLATTNTGIDVTGTVTADGLTVSTATGSSSITPTDITIKTETSASDWSTTDEWGRVVFYSDDVSNGGAKAHATIGVSPTASGGGLSNLVFKTSNSTPSLVKRMDINEGGNISFYEDTGTTAKFFWDASAESLGIGGTVPASTSKLQVFSGADGRSVFRHAGGDGGITVAGSGVSSAANIVLGNNWTDDSGTGFTEEWRIALDGSSDSLQFKYNANANEAMRIDSSGSQWVGATSLSDLQTTGGAGFWNDGSYGRRSLALAHTSATDRDIAVFYGNGSLAGTIRCSPTATSYNTSSDYRLKEDWQPMSGSIDRLKALNPVNFAWKADGSRVDGFLAHEAAEVVPEAVSGEKDAVEAIGNVTDAEGTVVQENVTEPAELAEGQTWTKTEDRPVYQGIDQAKLVPLLTAALQEAVSKIEALETRIAALEA